MLRSRATSGSLPTLASSSSARWRAAAASWSVWPLVTPAPRTPLHALDRRGVDGRFSVVVARGRLSSCRVGPRGVEPRGLRVSYFAMSGCPTSRASRSSRRRAQVETGRSSRSAPRSITCRSFEFTRTLRKSSLVSDLDTFPPRGNFVATGLELRNRDERTPDKTDGERAYADQMRRLRHCREGSGGVGCGADSEGCAAHGKRPREGWPAARRRTPGQSDNAAHLLHG